MKNFPIQNNVTVSQSLNQSIFEAPSLEIQWAKRGTVPAFTQNNFTEGIYNSAEQTTTLRLRGNLYTLQFARLVQPQHKSFLSAQDKNLCNGEIVMLFESGGALTEEFVFLCIPLLNKATTILSPYLEAIRQDRLPGKPISLDTLLPSSKKYTSYTTCLQRTTSNVSSPVQAAVLVFTEGLSYPDAQLKEVLKKMKDFIVKSGQLAPRYLTTPPALGPLIKGLVAMTGSSFLIQSETEYRNYLRTSELTFQGQSSNRRTDSTDAYKCVPLKPDQDVKNNQIIIDTDKGVPLSQILKEKTDEQGQGQGQITPGMVERMIAAILGTAAGIFILSVIAYLFSRVTSDDSYENFPWFVDRTKDMLPMVFISIVVGIVGFLIGFFTSGK